MVSLSPLPGQQLPGWWEPWACHQATILQSGNVSGDDPGCSRSTADGIALVGGCWEDSLQGGNSAAGNGRWSEGAGEGLQVREVTVWGQHLVYCLEQELEEGRDRLERKSGSMPRES